jgi:diaminopimelate decarboxylase
MESFPRIDGELHCERVPLRRLAEEFGTPLYVYSQGHIVEQYERLDRAFGDLDHLICYAVKANSNVAVLRVLAEQGAGFDIVSGGDLYRVVQAGGEPARCVFSGVGKTRDEIEYALKLGILAFNVESESELRVIASAAKRLGRRAPIAVRVNPGVDAGTHDYISTGKEETKFGISIDRAMDVYRAAVKVHELEVTGVQIHVGSQITSSRPFVRAIKKTVPLIKRLRELAPATLKFFDIGGGLGIRYRNEQPPTAELFAAEVVPHLEPTGLTIVMEPGRFLVGNAGVLLTRVIYVKRSPVKNFLVTDAGMNDLIRPALYNSYHEIVPVQRPARKKVTVDVVGPVCETGDFFAHRRRMSTIAEGELLAIMSAGAYGMTMASNYNSRARPAEVMASGRQFELVRRRETMKDLVEGEVVPQWLL